MTKVAGMEMSVREFLEDTYRPRSEPRPDIAARDQFIADNRRMLEREKRITRRWGIAAGIICSVLLVGVLCANWYQQSHLTETQRQMLAENPQYN